MKAIFALFIAFAALGIIFQKYDRKARLLVLLIVAGMVIYITVK